MIVYEIIILILCAFIALYFVKINSHKKTQQKKEIDFAYKLISGWQAYYQKVTDMYKTLSIMRHDFKCHLRTINELANSYDTEGIKQYITDIQENIPNAKMLVYCGNSMLNALLSNYAEDCENMNIKLNIKIDLPKKLFIPNYEICVIFGNLLENAIEACKKLNENRIIDLEVKPQGSFLAIMMKNTFNGIVREKNGKLLSSKKNGGFGLQSVKTIAENYGNHMVTEWDAETFTVYIMLEEVSPEHSS